MIIKGITDECFSDYKRPSMFIAMPICSFKCDKENGCQLCQNSSLVNEPNIEIGKEQLIERFMTNPITEAIVFGGLEPFDSILDLSSFIDCARRQYGCEAPIIIYTGYTEEEIMSGNFGIGGGGLALKSLVDNIISAGHIIIKFGRFRPNQEKHYDPILGVVLSSPNQYAREYE